ncbi:hypothetical protein DID77_03520 [Candidatus Marinamargulisbacteria bacterium SCGC AG-439-L15]|nr:hypothetical protein DID77_03520 [Candidatus Marinamargulisbacteria bacterium SCGC AG-439-L15]
MENKVRMITSCRWGAYCALTAGALYVCIVCCAFLSPASIASYVTSEQYFLDFQSYRPIFIFLKWLMLFANMAMVGVVSCFHSLHRDETHGLMTILSTLAIIGFGVGMYQSVQDLSMVPYLADQYESANQLVRDVIIAIGVANPSIYIITLGLPGIWFIAVSLLAWDNPDIPRGLLILGIMWGSGNIMTVIAHVLIIIELIYLVAFGALVFAPLWSIYEGIFLLRVVKKLESSE